MLKKVLFALGVGCLAWSGVCAVEYRAYDLVNKTLVTDTIEDPTIADYRTDKMLFIRTEVDGEAIWLGALEVTQAQAAYLGVTNADATSTAAYALPPTATDSTPPTLHTHPRLAYPTKAMLMAAWEYTANIWKNVSEDEVGSKYNLSGGTDDAKLPKDWSASEPNTKGFYDTYGNVAEYTSDLGEYIGGQYSSAYNKNVYMTNVNGLEGVERYRGFRLILDTTLPAQVEVSIHDGTSTTVQTVVAGTEITVTPQLPSYATYARWNFPEGWGTVDDEGVLTLTVPLNIIAGQTYEVAIEMNFMPRVLVYGGTAAMVPDTGIDYGMGYYSEGAKLNIAIPSTLDEGVDFTGWSVSDGTTLKRAEETISVGAVNSVMTYTANYTVAIKTPQTTQLHIGASRNALGIAQANPLFGYSAETQKDSTTIPLNTCIYPTYDASAGTYAFLDLQKGTVTYTDTAGELALLTGKGMTMPLKRVQPFTYEQVDGSLKRVDGTPFYMGVYETSMAHMAALAESEDKEALANTLPATLNKVNVEKALQQLEDGVLAAVGGRVRLPQAADIKAIGDVKRYNEEGETVTPYAGWGYGSSSGGEDSTRDPEITADMINAAGQGSVMQAIGSMEEDPYGFYDLWGNVYEALGNGGKKAVAITGGAYLDVSNNCNISSLYSNFNSYTYAVGFRPIVDIPEPIHIHVQIGGTTLKNIPVAPGGAPVLLDETPVQKGMGFTGWRLEKEGRVTLVDASTRLTAEDDGATLVAHFEPINLVADATYKHCIGPAILYAGLSTNLYLDAGMQYVVVLAEDGTRLTGVTFKDGILTLPSGHLPERLQVVASAEEPEPIFGMFLYKIVDQTVIITGLNGTAHEEIDIPATINTLPVTAIAAGAFSGAKNLTSVTLPESITSIGDAAFRGCDALKEIHFLGAPPSVGEEAFPETRGVYRETFANAWEEVIIDDKWENLTLYLQESPVTAPEVILEAIYEAKAEGTLSGAKSYKLGATATLKASPKRGTLFVGWYTDKKCKTPYMQGGDWRATTIKLTLNKAERVRLWGKFIPQELEDGTLEITWPPMLGTYDAVARVGEEVLLAVKIDSRALPKVSAKGLPKGLKWDSKTFTITGKPTTPGIYSVTMTATNTQEKRTSNFIFRVLNRNEVPDLIQDKEVNEIVKVYAGSDAHNLKLPTGLIEKLIAQKVKVKGLPSGLKWNAKKGCFEGWAKTVKPGKQFYTVTFTVGKKVTTLTFEVVNREQLTVEPREQEIPLPVFTAIIGEKAEFNEVTEHLLVAYDDTEEVLPENYTLKATGLPKGLSLVYNKKNKAFDLRGTPTNVKSYTTEPRPLTFDVKVVATDKRLKLKTPPASAFVIRLIDPLKELQETFYAIDPEAKLYVTLKRSRGAGSAVMTYVNDVGSAKTVTLPLCAARVDEDMKYYAYYQKGALWEERHPAIEVTPGTLNVKIDEANPFTLGYKSVVIPEQVIKKQSIDLQEFGIEEALLSIDKKGNATVTGKVFNAKGKLTSITLKGVLVEGNQLYLVKAPTHFIVCPFTID